MPPFVHMQVAPAFVRGPAVCPVAGAPPPAEGYPFPPAKLGYSVIPPSIRMVVPVM